MVGLTRTRSVSGLSAFVIAGAMVLSACGGDGAGKSGNAAPEEITLGAVVEVSGAASAIGVNWQKGIELGIKQANGDNGFEVAGKRYKWKLELKDDQSLPDQAIAAYREFVGNNVNFLLGPGLSTAFPPAFNSLGNAKPIVMTPASAAASQFIGKSQGENLFITHLADTGDNGRVAKVVQTLVKQFSPKRVAILLPQDDAGELYTRTFSDYFKKANVDVVFSRNFPGDTRDFSSFITALRGANPDMVISGYLDTWMKPFLTQAAGAGLTSPVYVGAPGTNVSSVTGNAVIQNFVWSVTTRSVNNTEDPRVQDFRKAWNDKYGSDPDANSFWALSYYDPIQILTQALQKAGTVTDTGKIRNALLSNGDWKSTVLGEHFDKDRQQAVYDPQIGIYRNGSIKYVAAD